jgi:NADPH:quinone reductase-like Zn-dependent oxidoreductase
MKAIAYQTYGPPDVLFSQELATPTPGDGEVLIRVRAASVNPIDWHYMRGEPRFIRAFIGLRKPKKTRLGVDVAGRVEATGNGARRFKPGDEVFGTCRGAWGEYVCAPESAIASKPPNVTFEQAAAVGVAGFTALQGLRKGKIHSGQNVLINGASGGVGTFAVQIAKSFGATVTGVCSARNAEMVRSIGADRIIDYARDDFTSGNDRYDLIFDCIGGHSASALKRVMSANGICVAVGSKEGRGFLGALTRPIASRFTSKKFAVAMARSRQDDLITISDLMASGKVTPVIDRCYGLSETREAVAHVEEGHARGKVIITMP